MNIQDYKYISYIYNENTFKKQLVFQGIFLSFVILSVPISFQLMDVFQISHYLISMQISLFSIIWFSILGILEKKKIFITQKYYRYVRYRVCYLLIFLVVTIKVISSVNAFLIISILALTYIPIEIYSGYKEYIRFNKKMGQLI